MVTDSPSWAEVVLLALNVAQSVALAWISSRSYRVRRTDRIAAEDRLGEHDAGS